MKNFRFRKFSTRSLEVVCQWFLQLLPGRDGERFRKAELDIINQKLEILSNLQMLIGKEGRTS